MTHQEAIGLFKEVKKGPVVVTIGRRTSPALTASLASMTTTLSIKPAANKLPFSANPNEGEE
jgi:hypothetical protein